MPAHRGVLAALLLAGATLVPASAPVGAAPPSCAGRTATMVGTTGDDELRGTARADVIAGLAGDDTIDGGGGDDVICGGGGADRLDGAAGADRLRGQGDRLDRGPAGTMLTGDVLDGGPGDDRLDGGRDTRSAGTRVRPDTYSWASAPDGVVVDASQGSATGAGTDRLVVPAAGVGLLGSPQADRLTGSTGPDRIDGGAGDDVIAAGGGADRVYPDGLAGADGDDVVATGPGGDLVSSLAGGDRVDTGAGADYVEALSPLPTRVEAGPADDRLLHHLVSGRGALSDGGGGDDVVTFSGQRIARQATSVTIDLREGVTSASGVRARGAVTGLEGVRLLGDLAWVVRGTADAERVWAVDGGPLRVTSGAGNDRLTGTARADSLEGGSGTDTGYGEGGRDRCRSIERGRC
jgi:Ca2+-binding RTX toxin-like protein